MNSRIQGQSATTTAKMCAGLALDDTGTGGNRPPLVLLHGLTFDRRIWAPIISALREVDPDRRVISVDLPGHGESPPLPSHDLPRLIEVLHAALGDAAVQAPVLVGHSISGAIASLYAGVYPAAGVVNVDQPPLIAEFAQLVRSIEPQLRGPDFGELWQRIFFTSFHTELLPPDARELVTANSQPRQDIVLSYWQTLLEVPVAEIVALIDDTSTRITERAIPYLLVLGHQLAAADEASLREQMPAIQIHLWAGTGHFPHLARPAAFAGLLDGTAQWRR